MLVNYFSCFHLALQITQKKKKSCSSVHLFSYFSSVLCENELSTTLTYYRHETYVTQYRAIFVVNCKIMNERVSQSGNKRKRGRKRGKTAETETDSVTSEAVKPVHCATCSTEVGVIDKEEVYHFLNVLPSES